MGFEAQRWTPLPPEESPSTHGKGDWVGPRERHWMST